MPRSRSPWPPAPPTARGDARPQDHLVNYFTNGVRGGASAQIAALPLPTERVPRRNVGRASRTTNLSCGPYRVL